MKKLEMEIEGCVSCPYRKLTSGCYYCSHPEAKKIILDGIYQVPKECPLPDTKMEDIFEPGC